MTVSWWLRLSGLWPRWGWRVSFWLALLGVLTASLTPVGYLPDQVMDLWDKAQHALGFAGLAVLGRRAYPEKLRGLVGGLVVFGLAIELLQAASGWRQGDGWDWVADAVGVALGLILARFMSWRLVAPARAVVDHRQTP